MLLRVSSAMTAVAVACGLPAPEARALPTGGQVVGGQATIGGGGLQTTITQATDRGIINWQSFDIAAGEQVRFQQPSASSVTLNRVTGGGGASQIMGQLSANGTVVLVNPNGVLFGPTAQVNVGSLVATTADIADDRFLAGDLRFDRPGNPNAGIVNQGRITVADAGLAAFVAPSVVNDGVIEARLGTIELASGDRFTLDLYGDGLISLQASDAIQSQLVSNSGLLAAKGGKVRLTAAAASEVVGSLINMDGIVQATAVAERNGEIEIFAEGAHAVRGNDPAKKGQKQGSSTVLVSGVLDASGRNPGERGGRVTVAGDNVALLNGSFIDASGHTGLSGTTRGKAISAYREGSAGGDIRIGGDYLGQGNTPTAQNLYVDPGALILNDALFTGDAGRTIFWSDGTTQFYGNVYARALGGSPVDPLTWNATAGGNAGDGGFVETSGHNHIDAGGYVDLTASGGDRGTYFLDPTDITIYGNVDPAFQSTDGTINLATSLKLWLDASDTTKVTLTYSTDGLSGATATGTSGTNTITTSANVSANLAVGARIRLGSAGAVTTAATLGADTYTISAISGTTITLTSSLTQNYTGSTLHRGLVSQLADKSGQSNNANQATAANMPLWTSGALNGNAIIRLTGINNFSLPANITPSGSGVNHSYSILWSRPSSGNTIVLCNPSCSATYSYLQYGDLWYVGNRSLAVNMPDSTFAIKTAVVDDTTIYRYTDGLAHATQSRDTMQNFGGGLGFNGNLAEITTYSTDISANATHLLNQYQSAKWGIALTPPGTGATEVAKATASDGYSVFTTRYLERLSQSANVSLQATNNINLDFKGDTLNFATAGRSLTLAAGNQIKTASTGTITTNSGAISLTATNGILLNNALTLNSQGGNISLNNAVNGSNALIVNAGAGGVTFASSVGATTPLASVTVTGPVSLNGNVSTTNGAITFNNAVTLGNNSTINAGTGTLTFGGTVNGASNLTATARTFSFAQALGQTSPLGAVTLTSTNALALPSIFASSITASTTSGNLSGVGGLVTSGGSISLSAGGATSNLNLSAMGLVTGGGNVSLSAGQDLYLCTQINTGTGDLTASAARDLYLTKGDLTTGLVGWWKFDEGSGTSASDSSGGGNTASLVNGASWSSGDPYGQSGNGSLSLSVGAYAQVPFQSPLNFGTGNFTASLWINSTNPASYQALLNDPAANDSNFYLGTGAQRQSLNIIAGCCINGSAKIVDGSWHQVTLVRNSGVVSLYVDGKLDSSGSNTRTISPINQLWIGKSWYSYAGQMDDVRIYNTALSATQVQQLYAPQVSWGTGSTTLTAGRNAAVDLKGDTLTMAAGKNLSLAAAGTLTTSSAGSLLTSQSAGSGGNVTLTANDVILGGNLSGTGALTIQNSSAGQTIGINGGAGSLNLSATEMGYIQSGWNSLTIGSNTAGAVNVAGNLTLPWTNTSILSGSGNVAFAGTVNGSAAASKNLTVNAGTGTVTFAQPVGQTSLGAVNLTAGSAMTLPTIFASSITASTTSGNLSGVGGLVTSGGSISLSAGGATSDLNLSAMGLVTGGGNVSLSAGQDLYLSTQINTGTGDLTASAARDLYLTRPDLTTGLVGWWKFDEGSGTSASDSSGNGNTGTLTNGPTWSASNPYGVAGNSSISFDGVNDFVRIGTATVFDTNTPWAWAAWFLPAALSNARTVFGDGSGTTRVVWNGNANSLVVSNNVNAFQFKTFQTNVNVWSHIVIRSRGDGTNVDVFKDGLLVDVYNGGGKFTFRDIGVGGYTYFWNGLIDDVRIYNTALSASQVQQLNAPQVSWGTGSTTLAAGRNAALDLKGDTLTLAAGKNLSLAAAGTLTTSSAGSLLTSQSAGSGGNVTLTATSGTLDTGNLSISAGGDVSLTSGGAMTLGTASGKTILARSTGTAADLTIASGKTLSASGSGSSLVLASGRNFVNNAGSGALSAPNGRWLVYSADPAQNTLGGLTPGFSQYNTTYAGNPPASIGNAGQHGLLYSLNNFITLTADNLSRAYGSANPALTYGFFCSTGCSQGDATTGAPSLTTLAGATTGVGTSSITIGMGSLALTGAYSAYQVQLVGGTLTITQAPLTVAANNRSKTYGDVATFAGTEFTATGLKNAETIGGVSLSSAGAGASATVAGGPYSIAVSNATGGTFNPANYSISYNPGTLSVVPRSLVAGLQGAVSKTYDGTTAASLAAGHYLLTGVIGADAVSLNNPASGSYDSKNAGSGKTVSVSGLTLGGAAAGNYQLASTSISGNIGTIVAKPLWVSGVTAQDKTYDGTSAATLTGGAISTGTGLVAGDSVTLLTGSATGSFADKHVGANKAVTASGYSISGADSGNYALSQPAGLTASITAKLLSILGVTAQDKTYDGTTSAALNNGSAALSGVVGGDAVTLSSAGAGGAFADKHVGANKAVTASGYAIGGSDSGNYALSQPTGLTASITRKLLGISGVTAQDKTYDGTSAATLTGGAISAGTGLVAGDSVTLLTGSASGSFADKHVGANKAVTASGYAISGADSGNYALSQPAGLTANITARTLTASLVGSVSKVYDGDVFATLLPANYSMSGKVAGDSLLLNSPGIGTYDTKAVGSGKTVTVSGLGLVGGDAGNYQLASSTISGSVGSITARPLNITGVAIDDKVYDGDVYAVLRSGGASLSGVVFGDVVSLETGSASGAFADKHVGANKAVTASGYAIGGSDSGNYALSQPTGLTASITQRLLSISGVAASNKVYDGTTTAALSGGSITTATGLVAGDSVTLVTGSATGSFADKHVGANKAVTASGYAISGADSGNYALSQPAGLAASITARGLSVTATASDKVYDGTAAAAVALSDDRVAGDALAVSYGSAVFDSVDAGAGKAVTVSGLSVSGADAGNYQLVSGSASGSASVFRRALRVRAHDASVTAGAGMPAFGYSYAGLVAADSPAVFSGGLTSPGGRQSEPGTYPILQGSLGAGGNYTIEYTPGLLTVGFPVGPILTAQSASTRTVQAPAATQQGGTAAPAAADVKVTNPEPSRLLLCVTGSRAIYLVGAGDVPAGAACSAY